MKFSGLNLSLRITLIFAKLFFQSMALTRRMEMRKIYRFLILVLIQKSHLAKLIRVTQLLQRPLIIAPTFFNFHPQL